MGRKEDGKDRNGSGTSSHQVDVTRKTTELRLGVNLQALLEHLRRYYTGKDEIDLEKDAVALGYVEGVMKNPNEAVRLIQVGVNSGDITQAEARVLNATIVPLAVRERMNKSQALKVRLDSEKK